MFASSVPPKPKAPPPPKHPSARFHEKSQSKKARRTRAKHHTQKTTRTKALPDPPIPPSHHSEKQPTSPPNHGFPPNRQKLIPTSIFPRKTKAMSPQQTKRSRAPPPAGQDGRAPSPMSPPLTHQAKSKHPSHQKCSPTLRHFQQPQLARSSDPLPHPP